MILRYQKELNGIDNCPLKDDLGSVTLYRWCFKNIPSEEDTKPHAVLFKPKYQKLCKGWGLSTFNSLESALNALRGLPSKTRSKFNSIASIEIDLEDGIKYQTGINANHVTFFPVKELNVLPKLKTIQKDVNK